MEKSAIKRSKAFTIFEGDYVSIVTKLSVERVTQTERELEQIKHPLVFEGFLTDECRIYYYLGELPDTYSQVVKKVSVVAIEAKAPPPENIEVAPAADKGLN